MNTNTGITALTHGYHAVLARLEPQTDRLVLDMTGRIIRHLESHRGSMEIVLREVTGITRRDLLDRMLSREFLIDFFPEPFESSQDEGDTWVRNCAYIVRRLATELVIPQPVVRSATPLAIWAAGSVLGAASGVILPSLFGMDPQMRLMIATALSPAGALGGALAAHWLSRRATLLHRLLDIRSKDMLDMDQLADLARDCIRSWITTHIVIILLTGRLLLIGKSGTQTIAEPVPERLLSAIQKLSQVPVEHRGSVAEEVIQEFLNAGYRDMGTERVTWSESLRSQYDTVGIVSDGDPCRVLAAPIIQDGEIRRKGRLTRLR